MRTILVLMDTLRRDYLSCYHPHTDCRNEQIHKFAMDSCRFDYHFVGSMPCMPARRDIFTGRLNFLERSWGPIEIYDTTLPQVLFHEGGIRSHMITDHAHYFRIGGENYCQQFNTYEFFRGQESDPWVSLIDDPWMPEKYYGEVKRQYQCNRTRLKEEKDYSSVKCFESAIQWVEENKDAKDFFLMVETFDPHEPFDVVQEYLDLYQDQYDGPLFDLPKYHKIDEETDEAMEHLRKRYKALITMSDHHFGRLIQTLKDVGMYEDTMIILTTDHGYCLGERSYIGKNYMPAYNELANIPLLVHFPHHAYAGTVVKEITQNIDLMPTILDYQQVPIPNTVKGHSLRLILEDHQPIHEYALYGTYGLSVNLFDGRYTYMRGGRNQEKLYEYTTSLTTIRNWLGKKHPEEIACGHFLAHVPYPLYRVPSHENAIVPDPQYVNQDHLFDLLEDEGQTKEVEDEQILQQMETLMIQALQENHAPEEQYERLGFK